MIFHENGLNIIPYLLFFKKAAKFETRLLQIKGDTLLTLVAGISISISSSSESSRTLLKKSSF